MSNRVLELIRVSTEGQAAEGRASIPAQRAINRHTAQVHGLTIVRSIEITDVSGAAVLLAPEMQELMCLMADPEIHGVVAREFSRLIRPENFSDYALLQAFADTKTILYLPEGPIDLSSKTGRLMGTIRAAIAGLERSEILERVWSAKEEKRKAGKFAQSTVCLPFGVGYTEQAGWFYKADAERVRQAFRMFLEGDTSYWSIGKKVGIDPCTVRSFMRNPIYCGWRVIDKKRDMSPGARRPKKDGRQGDRKKIARAPEEIIRVRVIHEPLISETEFDQVQQMMTLKRTRHWRNNPNYAQVYTYNGFLTCARCGDLIYTYRNRREHRYYVCKNKQYPPKGACRCETSYMRREVLESKLDTLFAERLTDEGFLMELLRDAECNAAANAKRQKRSAERLEQQIESLKQKRQRVLDTYFEGVISRDERDQRIKKIESDLRVAEETLLREVPDALDVSPESLARIVAPFHHWEFLNRDDKRKLLAALTPEIKVADYRVHGLFLMQPLESRHNGGIHTDKDS